VRFTLTATAVATERTTMSDKATHTPDAEVEAHGLSSNNVNETATEDADAEVEAHGVQVNVNESVVENEPEVEAHGVAINVNETAVEDSDAEAEA
jgi:hypothetical protein